MTSDHSNYYCYYYTDSYSRSQITSSPIRYKLGFVYYSGYTNYYTYTYQDYKIYYYHYYYTDSYCKQL